MRAPPAIRRCAIMAVEGEKDDVSGVGQTLAALDLTPNLSSDKKVYYLQEGVGHCGVFTGRRFRSEIKPRIVKFLQKAEMEAAPARDGLCARSTPAALIASALRGGGAQLSGNCSGGAGKAHPSATFVQTLSRVIARGSTLYAAGV